MNKSARIFVSGHRGMVGSALVRRLQAGGYTNQVDPRYFRPTQVATLLCDASKARRRLGWVPATTLAELVREMVACNYSTAQRDQLVAQAGFSAPAFHE